MLKSVFIQIAIVLNLYFPQNDQSKQFCLNSRYPQVARQMHLHRGVLPVHFSRDRIADWMKDVDDRIQVGAFSKFTLKCNEGVKLQNYSLMKHLQRRSASSTLLQLLYLVFASHNVLINARSHPSGFYGGHQCSLTPRAKVEFRLVPNQRLFSIPPQFGIDFGREKGFLRIGDPIVCITGWRQGAGSSNTVRIIYVEDKATNGNNAQD